MTSIFLGSIKNLLHKNNSSANPLERITRNLGKSNLGLYKSNTDIGSNSASQASGMDRFDIAEHICDLLSPACGMTEEEKESYYNKIMGKLKSGKKLSPEEMRFLQAEYPALYQQAARVQAMRDGFEARLKTATSKQKAWEMYADSLSHVADNDPMKEYIVAAYQDTMKNFEKQTSTKHFRKLRKKPNTKITKRNLT